MTTDGNMKRHKIMNCVGNTDLMLHLLLIMLTFASYTEAIRLTQTDKTYAKFPKWNACTNGSFNFDFKTTHSNGILMYTDDNGRYDYVETQLVDGAVRLRMNIVDGKDGSIQITLGSRLNDNRWHRVEVKRNRMATTLYVDGDSLSQLAFGSDFHFGEISKNNFVFLGGVPKSYMQNLKGLSLPSILFDTRFEGDIRNVIYGNCTCSNVRGVMLEGVSVSKDPPEACERNNPCGNCLCYSQDDGPGCQCIHRHCAKEEQTYYHLPMDELIGQTLRNPSGLDANVTGSPALIPGVIGRALRIDGRIQQITVSGPGHRYECFGDLGLCPDGYTLAMWTTFGTTGSSEGVYLSNGGHSSESHGVAMLYKTGSLTFIFRMKDGKEWRVKADDVLPRRWYHVAVTWKLSDGLTVFINGESVAHEGTHSFRVNPSSQNIYNDFVIGRSNDVSGTQNLATLDIDEFQFWSSTKSEVEIREEGAVYKYRLSMDEMRNGTLLVPKLEPRTGGYVRQVPGKIGKALSLLGDNSQVDIGYFGDNCLGNTTHCTYGLLMSMWISFTDLVDNGYYIASGLSGFTVYSYGNELYVTVKRGDRLWRAVVPGIERGQWYFLEISWNQHGGLSVYLDQDLKTTQATSVNQEPSTSLYKNFYLGRANTNMFYQRYGKAVIDDVEMYNADRDTLLFLDFIQRDEPKKHHYGFDVMSGSRIRHATTLIETSGDPGLVPGKIGDALYLNGRNQMAEFDNADDCLGNLDFCRHGVLLALWFKPDDFKSGMNYLSSAINGLALSYVNRKFRATAMTTTRKWNVMTPVLTSNKWYYLEVSWNPEIGLSLYTNNQLLDVDKRSAETPEIRNNSPFQDNKFYLGRKNGNQLDSQFGAATYDEMEYWYGPREYLLAFGYIQRGKPQSYYIDMEQMTSDGRRLVHPSLPITLRGNPSLVPGRVGNALKMNGIEQTMSLGDQTTKCLGNLRLCRHGLTISMWIRVDEYDTNMYILSTGREGVRMYYREGYIYVTMDNDRKSWRTSIPKLNEGEWHYLELSWHPDFDLNFYLDNQLIDNATFITVPREAESGRTGQFMVGGPNRGDTPGQRFSYSNMAIDEMEIWYGRREELLAFDYIVRDAVEYESFSMETAQNGVVYHPRFTVNLEMGATLVKGKVGNAVFLNGNGQFVDLGNHMDKCLANLDRCNHGITMSMWLNPRALQDNTYFLSSPTYSLYYKDGQLQSQFRSGGKEWNVATPKFRSNTWQQVMLSWEPESGLIMYIDDMIVSKDARAREFLQRDESSSEGSLYIGKSSDSADPTNPRTADSVVDEVQYWYANIQRLQNHGLYGGQLHQSFPLGQFDTTGTMRVQDRTLVLKGSPSRVRGQHYNAIKLNGKGQFIDLGDNLTCGGSIDQCKQGFTMRFSLKPERLVNNMYFVGSYPISIFYRDGKLYTTVRSPTKSWTVAAPGFQAGVWQVVDASWHPETGLTMFIDDEEVGAHKTHGTEHELVPSWETKSYIGRSLGLMRDNRYANGIFENFEVWNVRRDVLLANNGLPNIDDVTTKTTPPSASYVPPLITARPVTNAPNDGRDVTVDTVVVTSVPGGSGQLIPVVSGSTSATTSKIIRVYGNGFIGYDLNVLTSEMLSSAAKESVSLQFISQDAEGLIWLFENQSGQKMHLSLNKNGQLLFVIDDGATLPQQVVLEPVNRQRLNDFRWHTVAVEKDGRTLTFSIDGQEVTSLTTRTQLEFIVPGKLYLGGSPDTRAKTRNLINSNFDGALTDVESRKFTRPGRELITLFLQFVDQNNSKGNYVVINKNDWNSGNWTWIPITTPATPRTTTRPPALPTPVTFTSASSVLYLSNSLDFRRGGSISFRFRTLEPRGLLALARGSAASKNFVAIEIFDGILYYVYDLGSFSSRKQFTDRRVDDGEWHTVTLTFQDGRMVLSLDANSFPTSVSSADSSMLYFYRLYIGGYDNYPRIPWQVYSRTGYRGCLESLKVNDIGVDLHSRFRDANIQGVEIGCRSSPRLCQTQPCVSGACKDRMDGYVCDCASTPFTGKNCAENAVVASWDGTYATNFEFNRRQARHSNDISFRFATPLRNTLLFKTQVDLSDDYIQGEIEEGKVKVTIQVKGQKKVFYTGSNINDYLWHTLHIRRRADDMEVWVDDEPRMVGIIGAEDFQLNIDRIRFGALQESGAASSPGNYIGYMQNFRYEDRDLFNELRQQTSNVIWQVNIGPGELPLLTYKPVTVKSSQTFFQLPGLRIGMTMKILFKFKTRESSGLLMYNAGAGSDALAIELSNGKLRLAYNMGAGNRFVVVPTRNALNDNQWHTVQVTLNERGQFTIAVDDSVTDEFASSGDGRLDLSENLYIAGLPKEMFSRPAVSSLIESRKGFRGCLASMDLNGAVPELLNFAPEKQHILNGCTDLAITCAPNACGPGLCMPGLTDYTCNCDMTGYVGTPCADEPIGYYFGKNGRKGMVFYEFPFEHQVDSDLDQIAFGFMTRQKDGVLARLQSSVDNKYVELRLENGFVISESKTGQNVVRVIEDSRKFNDGNYHVVRYIRSSNNTTLQVDNLGVRQSAHSGSATILDKVYTVMLGGRRDSSGAMTGNFYGIIGGAYWNGQRWLDMLYNGETLHQKLVQMKGDVVLTKPFLLIKGGGGPNVPVTPGPPDVVIPPGEGIPDSFGGGGVVGPGPGIGGTGGAGGGSVAIGGPGGLTGFIGGSGIFTGGAPVPLASAMVGPSPPPMATGARAGALVGTVVGTMAFMSSLMWALYKLKPGVPVCLSPGAGSAGGGAGGATPMSISPPRATSNLAVVQAASQGGGAGGGAGSGGAAKVSVVNGGAGGGGAGGAGGAGGGSSTFTSYFSSTQTAVGAGEAGGAGAGGAGAGGAGAGGVDAFDSATLRATGTFSNKGTTIGTPKAVRSNFGSSSSAYSGNYQSNTMSGYAGSGQASPGYGAGYMTSSSAGANIPDYDIAQGSGALATGQSYSTSTLNTNYNYQAHGYSGSAGSNTNSHFTSSLQFNPAGYHASALTFMLPSTHIVTYSASFQPSPDQAFVERSEDYVIQCQPAVIITGGHGGGGYGGQSSSQTSSSVGLVLSGEAPFATFTSSSSNSTAHHTETDHYSSIDSNTYSTIKSVTKNEKSSNTMTKTSHINGTGTETSRKTSLPVTSPTNAGYPSNSSSRFDSEDRYQSDGNIDLFSSTNKLIETKNDQHTSQSTDFGKSTDSMFQSSSTITSTLKSSAGNSLDDLDLDHSTSILMDFDLEKEFPSLSLYPNESEYATVDKTSRNPQRNLKSEISIEMTERETSSTLQRADNATTSSSTVSKSETSKSLTTSESQVETSFSLQRQSSFDAVDLDFVIPIPGSSSNEEHATSIPWSSGGNIDTSQVDRSENLIEESKPTFTRSTNKVTTSVHSSSVEVDIPVMSSSTDHTHDLDQSMKELLSSLNMASPDGHWETGMMTYEGVGDDIDDFNMEVQNLKTVTMNRQGQYVLTSGPTSGGAVTPGAAADEVRVDCCLMTKDGRSVVTGSSAGPPQAWDMQNGELLRIMKGDTIGSTNLHLVCGDRLLVGAVHADMEINEYSGRKGVFNHTLQIWDFVTGKPLAMAEGEYCSAMCPMSDNDKVLFGRTDKFGDATSIIAWDLLGNQPIKEMRYDGPVGNNDYINYLNMSKNDKYIVAGFSNSFDNYAEFMVFDMSLTSYIINEPAMLRLDANPDCTAILPKEEAVTGLRNGDLVIWSLRTGQPSRQLLSGGGAHAHSREVKAVTLSDDAKYLVSASADGTLKVWDLHTERPIHTLAGHSDEVWCCSISPDNEIVVSGSNDGTIRLWRMRQGNEMCVFNTGVDIFFVTMSHDKGTIVALGDKYGARKLIMLQVVRTKVKKIISS